MSQTLIPSPDATAVVDESFDELATLGASSAPEPDAKVARGSSFFARHGLSNNDVLLVFAAVLLTSVYLPMFSSWSWTPRMMIVLTAALPGVVALVDLARQRDRAAQFGLAALAWMSLSALLSGEAALAFKGHLLQEASVLIYAGALGLWALARSMTPGGRRLLTPWILGAFALNLAVGTFQVMAQWETGDLGLAGSRATGLTPNAGHLAAFMVAGVAMSVWRASRAGTNGTSLAWSAAAFLFGTGIVYSGSRIGLGALVLVCAWVVLTKRELWSVLASGAAVAGIFAGTFIARSFGLADSLSRTSALSQGGDRLGGRIDMWTAGAQAVQERPLLGWGAGRFRTATQGRWSFDFVARGSDNQQIPDAHNVVIALVVAIGIPGLVLLALFAWHAARRARGPLAIAAAGIVITWMFQPAGIVTLPLMMLMLGASMTPRMSDQAPTLLDGDVEGGPESDVEAEPLAVSTHDRKVSRLLVPALVLGVAASAWLGVADLRFASAIQTLDADAIDAVAPMFFDDPIVGRSAGQAWRVRAAFEPDAVADQLARHQATVDAEPKRPLWWNRLAAAQGQAGQFDDAVASAQQAIELQPTSLDAWRILLVASGDLDDPAMAVEAMTNLCRLGADECDR